MQYPASETNQRPSPEEEIVAGNIFTRNIDNLTTQAAIASETYTALTDDADVSKDARLIGAAIALAGAQIATALFQIREAR
jgi:hypothetical protein